VAGERKLDTALGHLFARALVAIARADDEIGPEEGDRLEQLLVLRVAGTISLDDLLLSEPLEPHRLAEALRGTDPFRSAAVHPGELAAMILTDAIAVVLAKGYVSEAEAHVMVRFAAALGCSPDQIRALCQRAAPWLGTVG
jgi:tellurite resistance protein